MHRLLWLQAIWARPFLYLSLFLAFLTASSSFASQVQCGSLFKTPAVQEAVSRLLVQLDDHAFFLNYKLKREPEKLTLSQLSTDLRALEKLTEEYFRAAKIEFNSHRDVIEIKGLQDVPTARVEYSIYYIYGTKVGDPISRMLFAYQNNPRHFDPRPLIHFDPLLSFRHPGIKGRYSPSSRLIHIGPALLIEEIIGSSGTILHEGNHLNEHMKVLRGEMSLARFFLENSKDKASSGYEARMGLDEVDAFLRSYRTLKRFLKDPELNARRFSRVEISQERKDSLRRYQREDLAEYKKLLSEFIERGRVSLNQIQARVQKWDRVNFEISVEKERFEIVLQDVSGPYETINLELFGLVSKDDLQHTSVIQEKALSLIQWSLKKLDKAQQEIAFE